MKFCKDCKFLVIPDGVARCSAPQAESYRDPVNGTRPPCQDMRKGGHQHDRLHNWDTACSPEAKWYKEKVLVEDQTPAMGD